MDLFLALVVLIAGYYARIWLKTLKERTMSKFISILVTLVVSLFCFNALAFTPPPAPEKGWYIVDQAGKLSAGDKQKLNQKIEQVSKTTKNEFGILLLSTMDGDNIEDAAYETFKKWGVGKRGLDNGCLIVVSFKERKSRIETGKGVGGDVPDITAKNILDTKLNPHLKKGDVYGGLDETLTALSSHIESRHNQKADPPPTSNPSHTSPVSTPRSTSNGGCAVGSVGGGGFGLFLVIVLGVIAVVAIARSIARRAAEQRQLEEEALRAAQRREAERARKRAEAEAQARREREAAKKREKEAERQRLLSLPTPVVPVPSFTPPARYAAPPPVKYPPRTVVPRPESKVVTTTRRESSPPTTKPATPTSIATAAVATAGAAAAAALLLEEQRQREAQEEADRAEARRQRQRAEEEREEREAQARRQREQEEADQRRRDEEARQSSYSSYSSYDSGSSSSYDSGSSSSYDSGSSGSWDSGGGGFGGGDSGGGGASGDW